ncbi:MAG TPA: hydantoinase/oxoprolinase family protein, partial [Gemmatirosa sp.]
RVARYLRRLGERLGAAGYPAPGVMTSGGGVLRAGEAAEAAAALALSGPAGGVAGAAAVLAALGIRDALTLDVGGTSADVGLVLDGEPLVEAGGAVAGVPIALPRVLVDTVSAGGGSIAWVDDGGALRVGPRSAGAVPGPAAFGRGGIEATVTDAQVVLGRLVPARLSGDVSIDAARAWEAVSAVAARLDGRAGDAARVRAVAEGIIAAADAEMARALRRVSVERGVDPRGLVLVAFGGGGPLHACALAARLGVTRVLVPPHAGVLSAVGLAAAPDRREALIGVARFADALSAEMLGNVVDRAARSAGAGLERRSWARVRYAGQGAELDVPVHGGDDGAAVAVRFAAAHARRAGFTLERAVEVVSLRHAAVTPGASVVFARATTPIGADGVPSSDDAGARAGDVVRGPATLALADATLFVPDGWAARALEIGGWWVGAT